MRGEGEATSYILTLRKRVKFQKPPTSSCCILSHRDPLEQGAEKPHEGKVDAGPNIFAWAAHLLLLFRMLPFYSY